MNLSVIILSFNSEITIEQTIRSVLPLSDDIHVVDSYSSDSTRAIARKCGASVVKRQFTNYADQRNWAIDNLLIKYEWELHLDADEMVSSKLRDQLLALKRGAEFTGVNGYCIPRLVYFKGRAIRHGGMFPIWHMRLFRHGFGRCEEREYDQHFVVEYPTAKLQGWFIDDIRMPLSEWISRHNRWSDAEVFELLRKDHKTGVQAKLWGNPLERKRSFKNLYERLPPFYRAWLLFLYRYVFRAGFLDGKEGFIFFFLQTLWFRLLIDAKLLEHRTNEGKIVSTFAKN
jgi:glycosyltransferase involved in cell wall biosynthesis